MVKSKYLKFLSAYAYLYALLVLAAWTFDHFGIVMIEIPNMVLVLVFISVVYQSLILRIVVPRLGRRSAYVIGVSLLGTAIIIASVMTGGYDSPQNVALVVLIFISAMLGSSVPLTITWMSILGYLLAIGGFIPALGNTTIGVILTVVYIVTALCGWWLFRRFYVRQDPVIDELQSALVVEQLQSAAVIAAINDAIAIINRDGIVRHANQRFLDMMAMQSNELLGKHYAEVISQRVKIASSSSDTPRLGYNIAQVFKTGQPVEIETETIEYQDGRPLLDISVSLSPLKNDDGEVSAVLIIGRDISGLMKVQRLKDQFISTSSHELRTPLTVIVGYADLLLNPTFGKLGKKQRHYIERTRETAQLLTQLVNDILDIGELESGHRANKPEKIALKPFLDELVTQEEGEFDKKKIGLHATSPPFLVNVDKSRLSQVLDCLLSNALKFTPETGTVTIEATDSNSDVVISVTDSGPGVPEDKQGIVFDSFTKLNVTGEENGTGLGLTIAKKIVNDWGGTVGVKNVEGGGACFSFTIPPLSKPVEVDE